MSDVDPWVGLVQQLLRAHDGDDRCGCLRRALVAALNGWTGEAAAELWRCIASGHPGWSRLADG